jgi:hypothetical protein
MTKNVRKMRSLKPVGARASDSTLHFEEVGLEPAQQAEFRKSMLEAARVAVDAFPAQIAAVKGILKRVSPAQALAAFACYASQASLASTGEQIKTLQGIEQHHGEFLQAIVLSLPFSEWSHDPITPSDMGELFKIVPELTQTFFMQRILEGQGLDDDEDAWTVRSLQERIRTHTQVVRNWGYFGQVVGLSRELYASLDSAFLTHHGFSATDLIVLLAAIVSEFERRVSSHWEVLRKVIRGGKTVKGILKLYYKHVPSLEGSAEQFLQSLPSTVSLEQVTGMIMGHYDLRLLEATLVSPSELATLSGRPESVCTAVLKAIAYEPDALESVRPEHLFLENPVWDRPAIDLGKQFLIAMPQMAFSHIHRLLDRLAREAGMSETLSKRRSDFLEQRVEAAFRQALPTADIRPAVKWTQDGNQYEHDLLVNIDRTIVIVEAKSHRLTPQGLRGAPDRLKRHIKDLVLEPSMQSSRLESLIAAARRGDAEAQTIVATLGIDATQADLVIRLSVTLDDLSVLSSSEGDLKKIGWVPDDHSLAPSVLFADLESVIDVLDNELLFLHYLTERSYLQKTQQILGDELDFLGLYLASGFNLPSFQDLGWSFSPSGMSDPIDRYYIGREAGLKLSKPQASLRPYFRSIVERLVRLKPPGWTLAGVHLLSCADPAEQTAIERNLAKLRKQVRQNFRDRGHTSTLFVKPPARRKATVMFYLFPEALRATYHETLPQLATQAMGAHDIGSLVAFARCTDNWNRPFEAAMLMRRRSPSK